MLVKDRDIWTREDDGEVVRPTRITTVESARIMAYYPTSTKRGICLATWGSDFVTWQLGYHYPNPPEGSPPGTVTHGEWTAEMGHYFTGAHTEEEAWNDFWMRKERGY